MKPHDPNKKPPTKFVGGSGKFNKRGAKSHKSKEEEVMNEFEATARSAKARRYHEIIVFLLGKSDATIDDAISWARTAPPAQRELVAMIDAHRHGGTVHLPSEYTWALFIELLEAHKRVLAKLPEDPFEGLPR